MRTIEHAVSILVGRCGDPRCNCVHIRFCDANEEVFAQAAMALPEIPSLIEDVQAIAYSVAANKDD